MLFIFTDIFRIGSIPVSPITVGSESARRFDNRKEKSREILVWWLHTIVTEKNPLNVIDDFMTSMTSYEDFQFET
jgi:hypothetical protein